MDIATIINSSITARGLPFPIRATVDDGAVTLTVSIRARDGREGAERVVFPVPSDLVTLPGLSAALSRAVTTANLAEHIGHEVL